MAIACFGAALLSCTSASTGTGTMPSDTTYYPPCTDATVQLIQAANYDQSCQVDSDCVNIAAGDACWPCLVLCGVGGAINRNSLARYQNDISPTTGFKDLSKAMCHCPLQVKPCCSAGICHADAECPGAIRVPTGDGAAVDATE